MIRSASAAAALVVGVAGLSVAGAGAAYAFWTTSGSGTMTGNAATAVDLGVTEPVVSGLYPGSSRATSVAVTNSNPFPVALTAATAFGPVQVDAGHSLCNVSAVSFSVGTLPTAVLSASTGDALVPVTVAMSTSANDQCQGASFTSTLTVAAESR